MTLHPRPPLGETPVYGQCVDCGAIAWELLEGLSIYCMDCDPSAYRNDDDDDDDGDDDDLSDGLG